MSREAERPDVRPLHDPRRGALNLRAEEERTTVGVDRVEARPPRPPSARARKFAGPGASSDAATAPARASGSPVRDPQPPQVVAQPVTPPAAEAPAATCFLRHPLPAGSGGLIAGLVHRASPPFAIRPAASTSPNASGSPPLSFCDRLIGATRPTGCERADAVDIRIRLRGRESG